MANVDGNDGGDADVNYLINHKEHRRKEHGCNQIQWSRVADDDEVKNIVSKNRTSESARRPEFKLVIV